MVDGVDFLDIWGGIDRHCPCNDSDAFDGSVLWIHGNRKCVDLLDHWCQLQRGFFRTTRNGQSSVFDQQSSAPSKS
jgi:hypothetical protein